MNNGVNVLSINHKTTIGGVITVSIGLIYVKEY